MNQEEVWGKIMQKNHTDFFLSVSILIKIEISSSGKETKKKGKLNVIDGGWLVEPGAGDGEAAGGQRRARHGEQKTTRYSNHAILTVATFPRPTTSVTDLDLKDLELFEQNIIRKT